MLARTFKLIATAVGIVAVLLVVMILVVQVPEWWDDHKAEKLAHLSGLCNQFTNWTLDDPQAAPDETIPLKGKVLFVKMDSNSNRLSGDLHGPDFLTLELPENLFPEKAEDVGVIVGLHWGEQYVGQYEGGSTGYRETCTVKVYDAAGKRLVMERTIMGEDPPEFVSEAKDSHVKKKYYGPGCDKQILEMITKKL